MSKLIIHTKPSMEILLSKIEKTVKVNGTYSHNIISAVLRTTSRYYGNIVANSLIDKYSLSTEYSIDKVKTNDKDELLLSFANSLEYENYVEFHKEHTIRIGAIVTHLAGNCIIISHPLSLISGDKHTETFELSNPESLTKAKEYIDNIAEKLYDGTELIQSRGVK